MTLFSNKLFKFITDMLSNMARVRAATALARMHKYEEAKEIISAK